MSVDLDPCDGCDVDYLFGPLSPATIARMRAEIAQEPTTCPDGHPYDEANTYTAPNGYRVCRPCRRAKDRRRKTRAA